MAQIRNPTGFDYELRQSVEVTFYNVTSTDNGVGLGQTITSAMNSQATGYQIQASNTWFSTVAAGGVAVLPQTNEVDKLTGVQIEIVNTSNPVAVVANPNDVGNSINGQATNTSIVLGPNTVTTFNCVAPGIWFANSTAAGSSVVNVAAFGAVGDGVTDDTAAINAASLFAVTNGITEISFPAGKTFYVTSDLFPRQNLIWEGNGCTLTTDQTYPNLVAMFHNHAQQDVIGVPGNSARVWIGDVTADIVGPTNQLTLDAVRAGLAVGDTIGMRLGQDPWDIPETRFCMIAQVTAIAGNTITFDRWIPYNIFITSTYTYFPKNGLGSISVPLPVGHQTTNTNGDCGNKSVWKFTGTALAQNLVFRDFVFIAKGSGAIGGGISIQWGSNILIENVIANPNGVGDMGNFITLQFCQDVRIVKPSIFSNSNPTNNPSTGNMVGLAECRNCVVENHFSKNITSLVVGTEAFCDNIIVKDGFDVLDSHKQPFGYSFAGGSTMTLLNPSVLHFPTGSVSVNANWFSAAGGGQDGIGRITGNFIWRGPMLPVIVADPATLNCVFDYENGPDGYVRVDYGFRDRQSIKIPVSPSMNSQTYQLLASPLTQCDLFCSANVPTGSLTGLTIGNPATVNNISSKFVPGEVVNISSYTSVNTVPMGIGANYGGITGLNGTATGAGLITVFTSATAQAPGNFIGVSVEAARVLETGPPFVATTTVQTPSAIFGSNLVAWYKANTGVTGTNPITGWADQSGNGRNMTVFSGAPVLNSTAFNGLPAIVFGLSDAVQSSAFNIATNVAAWFIIARLNISTFSFAAPRIIDYFVPFSGTDFSSTTMVLALSQNGNNILTAYHNSVNIAPQAMPLGGIWIATVYNGPTTSMSLYLNSTTAHTTTGFTNDTLGTASTVLNLGTFQPALPQGVSMVVAELFMLNTVPSPAQLAAFQNYAVQTYNLVPGSLGNNRSYQLSDLAMDDVLLGTRSPGLGGTFVANGATPVSVSNINVAITDVVIFSLNTVGGTVGAIPTVKTITAGTGFTVAATAGDTSTYNYVLVKNV